MNPRTERIDRLFASRSFVVEAALLRIAAVIEQVKNLDDTTVFFELAAARLSAEIGALTDGATLAKFISRKLVTLRKLARRTWDEWNVPSRPKYHSYGGGLVGSASTQMRGIVDAMRDALAAYSDEEFDWIEKADSQFNEIINTAKSKNSALVSAVRHKVAYLSLLTEKLFGYDPVSALVSEAGDGDWTDVLIERLRNEPNYIGQHALNDEKHVEEGNTLWKDAAKDPGDFVFGKFRLKYSEKENGKYFELLNKRGEPCIFLVNFILLHTGITLLFDDLSVQRVNKTYRDIVFAIRKADFEGTQTPYIEDSYKDAFFAQHVTRNIMFKMVSLEAEAKRANSDIYRLDSKIAKMRGSKEICFALEWLCLSDVTNPEPYVQLASAYINADWPHVANMLIYRAYNNSFVKGGAEKCDLYESSFPEIFKEVQRPEYLLVKQDPLGQFTASLWDTRKIPSRMLRVPESVWSVKAAK